MLKCRTYSKTREASSWIVETTRREHLLKQYSKRYCKCQVFCDRFIDFRARHH